MREIGVCEMSVEYHHRQSETKPMNVRVLAHVHVIYSSGGPKAKINRLKLSSVCREPHAPTQQARIVEIQDSNTGGGFAVQSSPGNLPAQVGAQVMQKKLGITGYHQPSMPM